MTAPLRSAAKLFLALQIPLVFACADAGPGGPGDPAGAQFAGLLTVTEGTGPDAGSSPAFRGAAPLAGARVELVAGGDAVATLHTGATGAFSSTVPSGAYTVQITMNDGPPLEFALDLPAGGAMFAKGRVDQTPSGDFSLNVQLFRDGDADGQPDDAFRLQILDRVQGDGGSGFEDVIASEAEAEAAVTLCHVPPGNPDAAHTIAVGAPAVPVHLAHGDAEGACAEDGAEEDPEDEDDPEGEDPEEDDGQAKVLVCHVPPGNPENPVTIEIGESALPAHLAHGDTEGACEGDEVPDGEDGDDGTNDDGEEEEAKVLVCHVPPGNPENPVTIEVGESAVPAHLAHGDTEGACPEEAPLPDDGEDEEDEGGEGEG
jgi:hypothetical protein